MGTESAAAHGRYGSEERCDREADKVAQCRPWREASRHATSDYPGRNCGKRNQYVEPSHRVGHACGEVGEISGEKIAVEGYSREICAAIHQIGHEHAVGQEQYSHGYPEPARHHIREHQQERPEQGVEVEAYVGHGAECGACAPHYVEQDELEERGDNEHRQASAPHVGRKQP